MNYWLTASIGAFCLFSGVGGWLGWQLLRQNGRLLLRLDELEKRLDELEFGELDDETQPEKSETRNPKSEIDQSLADLTATDGNGAARASRFGNRSLARSKLKRDGLSAGTPAPDFRLPRLDGSGELSLAAFRGRRVVLVFSDPHCGPCNHLAPQLETWHRENPGLAIVMISRGEPSDSRAKVRAHGLTFPVVLQQRWEISRRYAMFATPIAYLIDESGIIARDVALGAESILALVQSTNYRVETPPAPVC